MMKIIIYFLLILLTTSCENNKHKIGVLPEVVLYPTGDTNFVSITYSNILVRINYSDNKPKYVLTNNLLGLDSLRSHYTKHNQGIYFSINPYNSRFVSAMGYKYLNGDAGADILIDTINGSIKNFTNWQDYSNNGQMYDVSKLKDGAITLYNYKDGDMVDSVVFVKKK